MTVVMRLEDVTLEYPVPRQYRKEHVQPSGVRNISLEVNQGEVLGIIGRNGSGKSTLLKMMAGVFPPDSGTIATRGSVSLLAGVGVGFNKELTGRENAYLYGALMGRTTAQIDELIEEIQSFAELDHHFDRPIRTYSSGMKSRLGISVATAFKPDLLLIDEVLGVGDISFREKSQRRVKDLISNSGCVVIVSHSMGLLKSICTKLLVINDGEIVHYGDTQAGMNLYAQIMRPTKTKNQHVGQQPKQTPSFRKSIEQSMKSWREDRAEPRSKLITLLNKKIPMKKFMQSHSRVKSENIGEYNHIASIDFSTMPDRFVLKPQDGASNNGVFLLERNQNGSFYDSMRGENYTPAEIVKVYLDEHHRFSSINLPVYIEERFDSANPKYEVPLDYKGFCFGGKVGLIMQRDVSGGREYSKWKYAYYTRDWERLDEIRKGVTFSDELHPPPEKNKIIQQMEYLASKIPLRFCSMDMYNTTDGVAFGECTIHTGSYKSFNQEWNIKLGEMYENAKYFSDEEILAFLKENSNFFG
tara:strand:+ start:1330 stop:2910 length:1581 start_codon:yes stop_codon:yes gene_type:complete